MPTMTLSQEQDFEEGLYVELGPHGPWMRHRTQGCYVLRGKWQRMDYFKPYLIGPQGRLPQ